MGLKAQVIHENNTRMTQNESMRVQMAFIIAGWYIYFKLEYYDN